jgi:hypothetical protein
LLSSTINVIGCLRLAVTLIRSTKTVIVILERPRLESLSEK